MAVETVCGGPGTSGAEFRSGFLEQRAAPTVVSPKIIGKPSELAFLQQRRRAAEPILRAKPVLEIVAPIARRRETEVKPFIGGQKPGELILATNPTLDTLLDNIHYTRPNWNYLNTKLAERDVQSDPKALHGFLAELHINTILQTLAGYKKWKNVLKLVDLDKMETPNYRFSTSGGSLGAISKKTREYVAEYDALIEVDSLPTVIEVKARSVDSSRAVNLTIGDEHIRKLFAPLQEYYGPNTYFGYALVTVPETTLRPSPTRENFQKEGGLVTTMNTTLLDLKTQSLQVVFEAKKSA